MAVNYREFQKLNLPVIEQEMLAKWSENQAFEKSVSLRDDAPSFVFYEGPPSANGMPGIHHVISRTLKDLVCRYKTMRGFQVNRKAGWDTHGLPIELGVEKELGITKEDIGKKISVEEYNRKCREAVMRYKDKWDDLTKKMGYWVDLNDPYITFDNNYIETLWYLLSKLYEKGLLYESVSIQPYSPAAGTGLSSHELNQPGTYKMVKDTSAVVMFHVKPVEIEVSDLPKDYESNPGYGQNSFGNDLIKFAGTDVFLLAWTTTPWTLPSNLGLTVGPNIDYVLLPVRNQYTNIRSHVILAYKLVEKIFSPQQIEELFIVELLKGELSVSKTATYDGIFTAANGEIAIVEVKSTGIKKEALSKFKKEIEESGYSKGYFCSLEPILENIKSEFPEITFLTLQDFIDKGEVLAFKGRDIVGCEYEQLLPFESNSLEKIKELTPDARPFRVIDGDFVTTEDGTGIVHTAPAFGADDYKVGKKNKLGILTLVDRQGKFVDGLGEFSNRYVKNYKDEKDYVDVNVDICVKLKKENRAFKIEKYEHNYPHCWRTDKPVLYYPLDAWFIKTTELKDRLVALNKTINWKPRSTGEGRFGNWLENMVDWNLSRSRFWGTALPIWKTEDGNEKKCIGSVPQLKEEAAKADKALATNNARIMADLDLHKPYVDDIVLVSDSGKPMKRVPDLIDVWFDSGAMPYAQWGLDHEKLKAGDPFPFKQPFNKNYPADFIAEGVDQTRGWFYTLHAIAGLLFDSVAYKTCVSNGLVLDKNGNKMSKRLGNVVDPFKTIEQYGADATRWYLITNASPWENMKFDLEGIKEVQRKFFGTLYNTYQFFVLYANVDGFAFKEAYIPLEQRPEIDRWILSSLNTLVKKVTEYMDDYEPTQAGRAIEEFMDEHLSNWYVRLCRRRFWKGEYEHDKVCAYQTLYECLETVLKLMAPISPFFSDALFQNLNAVTGRYKVGSVHHTDYPVSNLQAVDASLEERMQLAQDISSLILSLRKTAKLKVRQPLQKILVPVLNKQMKAQIERVEDLIKSEVNVKEIEFLTEDNGFIKKKIKPNYTMLGKKLGAKMKPVAAALAAFTQDEIAKLEKDGSISLQIENEPLILQTNEVEITSEDIPGWMVANKDALTVALDVTVTPELVSEGNARELVNRIQKIRKDSGFELTDRILVKVTEHQELNKSIAQFNNYICTEILADKLELVPELPDGTEIEVNDIPLKVFVTKKA